MSGVAVTPVGVATILTLILFLLLVLKLSFRGLPVNGTDALKPEPNASTPAAVK